MGVHRTTTSSANSLWIINSSLFSKHQVSLQTLKRSFSHLSLAGFHVKEEKRRDTKDTKAQEGNWRVRWNTKRDKEGSVTAEKQSTQRRQEQAGRGSEKESKKESEQHSWALLTPCKALFRNKETSLESNISECHILAVSMVLVFPAWLKPTAVVMKADASVGWAVCGESRITKGAKKQRKHEPINLCCLVKAWFYLSLLNLVLLLLFGSCECWSVSCFSKCSCLALILQTVVLKVSGVSNKRI